MFGKSETDVLMVGAGPVGMFTALLLADNGIKVEIVDTEWRTAARSYAGVLHPGSLALLDRAGLAPEILELGRRIDSVGFYEGASRQAEIRLAELPVDFPFLLALPQSALESLLENKLQSRSGVKVQWNHRLSDLQPEGDSIIASVDQLAETAQGYGVPTFEWIVKKTRQTRASFVVGADGHNSFVRQSTGIEQETFGEPEKFAVYEFETEGTGPGSHEEVRIVLDDQTTNVCWPLPNRRCRWSFQLGAGEVSSDADGKARSAVVFEEPAFDQVTKDHLHLFVQERAPWFKANIKEIDWSIAVQFQKRLARQLGRDRCWLIGDAAHQTGPVGMQSMNVGLREAVELADLLTRILRDKASPHLLETYNQSRRNEWQQLLGINRELRPRGTASPWVQRRCGKMLPVIPAAGAELPQLLDQLGLDLKPAALAAAV